MASKRQRGDREDEDGEDGAQSQVGLETMSILPIGAGNEVGRSCILLQYMGRKILLDCGIHPGYNGMAALPYFDEINPEEIDLLLITHFHLDHAASLPYFTEHTGFKGRIFMTHPTKAVMRMLLSDYIKLVNVTSEDILYDEKDLARCVEKIELIDYHQVMEHDGIKFWCYNAGHVLGAAMFMLEIAGVHVLYTGDYSMEDDRHLMAAEVPSISPDVLIVESTYGVQVHSPREDREARFTQTVAKTVRRGGRCLIPVFALGRAQELLLILDEFWQANKDLHSIPIYYASRLASKAIRVYQTYINMMNQHIRRQMDVANPFKFQHITNMKSLDSFNDVGPSVVMASPGMLQSGVSRQLFDRWCSEDKNTVLIPGYSVEGTLAKKILSSPDEVTGMDGRVRPLKCSVEYISFSAHVDFVENKKFMDSTSPANIILVHGELNEMMRLKTELVKKYSKLPESQRPLVQTPRNCQEILLEFHRDKVAKAVGSMTTKLPESRNLSGLLVNRNFNNRLMSADDLESYTQLKLGGVRQSLRIPFYTTLETLQQFFREVYDDVSVSPAGSKSGPATLSIHGGRVTVKFPAPAVAGDAEPARLHFEWDAGPVTDMIADSLVALAMQAQTSAAGIRLISGAARQCGHSSHSHKAEESEEGPVDSTAIAAVEALMQERFGPDLVSADCESGKITIRLQPLSVDGDIVLQVTGGKNGWAADVVACGDEPLRVRLEESLKLWQEAHLAAM